MNNNGSFVEKLRSSGLRPTKQRIEICKVLFNRKKTFHFTIGELNQFISKKLSKKISLATIYNAVSAFKKKGFLKEISINSDKTYYDTNISNHHHFYNESDNQLIDLEEKEIGEINIKKKIPGKKINSIEILVKIENNN